MATVSDKNKKGYDQLVLRCIGIVCTLLAIMHRSIAPGHRWMAGMAWIAFPIFAYLLVQGLNHSMDKALYLGRLMLFTAISEIPFDLMNSGKLLDQYRQSPMFTLLIGYTVLLAVDFLKKKMDNLIISAVAIVLGSWFGTYMIGSLKCEFPSFGMLFIMAFYVAEHVQYKKLLESLFTAVISMYVSNQIFATPVIGGIQYAVPVQVFAFIALILIWLHNGERGSNKLTVRYISYGFFPLSLLLFYFLYTAGVRF